MNNNKLTSLPASFNLAVNGNLYLNNNKLTIHISTTLTASISIRYEEGPALMGTPKHHDGTMAELAELAQDRQPWRATKHAIGSGKQTRGHTSAACERAAPRRKLGPCF